MGKEVAIGIIQRRDNMEFISPEKFLLQPKEIREVFLDWWKPTIGDLYSYKEIDLHDRIRCKCIRSEGHLINLNVINAKDRLIPLFTEGQLRSFIEEQTESFIEVRQYDGKKYLYLYSEILGECEQEFQDLLGGYWQMAVRTAKVAAQCKNSLEKLT